MKINCVKCNAFLGEITKAEIKLSVTNHICTPCLKKLEQDAHDNFIVDQLGRTMGMK